MRQLLYKCAGIVLGAALGVGCASARISDTEPTRFFREAKYEEAAKKLEADYKDQGGDESRDSLLYVLDIGLAYHSAGNYAESTKWFLKADKLAEIKDYTSLAAETSTLLVSDNIKHYKAEDFENVLINVYLAMNYAMIDNREDALVEARRVNHKLGLMVSEGKRKYKQNAFARYLSAILYEADGNSNDAYIDYKAAYDLAPDFPGIRFDLYRLAYLQNDREAMDKWTQDFNLSKDDKARERTRAKSDQGEIIVLYENGISPEKRPNPSFRTIPKFYPRSNPILYADIEVNGVKKGATARLENIEATAIENLDEKYAGIVAKKLAGVVAKEATGYGVEKATKSPLLGTLTKLVLYAADQADLRSWSLLPKDLQILRIPVDPGVYKVRALPVGGAPSAEKSVQITKPHQRVFVNFRSMP